MSLEVSLLYALPLLIVSLFHVIAQLLRGALFACETAWRMGFYIRLILQKSSKKKPTGTTLVNNYTKCYKMVPL